MSPHEEGKGHVWVIIVVTGFICVRDYGYLYSSAAVPREEMGPTPWGIEEGVFMGHGLSPGYVQIIKVTIK